ncbi:MAG: hypothetical protein QXX56_04030 [Candidatus Bathyarchaeia archaeon]
MLMVLNVTGEGLVPVRKMKIEVYDETGNRYTISFEGRVTREKVQKIFDMVELLGGIPIAESSSEYSQDLSKMDKILLIVKKSFPLTWFSAREVQESYERDVGEPIGLSTVLTYLSRLAEKGILIKTKNGNKAFFRLVSRELREIMKPL